MSAMPDFNVLVDADRPLPKRIHRKRDRWHLVTQGKLMTLVLDLETLDLLPNVTLAQSYGDALGDISFNFMDSVHYKMRVPERYLVGPEAALVTGLDPFEAHSPDRPAFHEAMAKIAERIEYSAFRFHELGHPEKDVSFSIKRKGKGGMLNHGLMKSERVSLYPLLDDFGKVVYDVRWHPVLQKVAYRVDHDPSSAQHDKVYNNYYIDEADGSQWRLVEPGVVFAGFRNIFFDIPVLQENQCFAGHHRKNVQWAALRTALTNKQRPRNVAVDCYTMYTHAHLFGPQGEGKYRTAQIVDPRTGQLAASMKQDLIFAMNRREGNRLRDVHPGLFLPDGSVHQKPLAHRDPSYDCLATFALYGDMLDRAPVIVSSLEKQANEDALRGILSPTSVQDTHPPFYALAQNTYPQVPRAEPYMFLGFDDLIGRRGRAIFIRANADLSRILENGKSLKDMTADDMAVMIEKHKDDVDPLIKILKIRKWRGVTPLESAIGTPGAHKWDFDLMQSDFSWLASNRDVVGKIMDAVAIQNDARSMRPPFANPLPEEEIRYHATGELDYIEGHQEDMAALTGMPDSIADFIYNRAVDDFNFMINMDALMHAIAIQPQPVDFSDDPWTLAHYNDLCARRSKQLREKNPGMLKLLNGLTEKGKLDFKTHDDARLFRDRLRHQILLDDEALRQDARITFGHPNMIHKSYGQRGKFILYNPLRNSYHVIDSRGRVLGIEWLERQDPQIVKAKFKKGEWSIRHWRMSSEPSVTFLLDQYADAGRLFELQEVFRERSQRRDANLVLGPPHEDASVARYGVKMRALHLERIVTNTAIGSSFGSAYKPEGYTGAADAFAKGDVAPQRIVQLERYYTDRKARFTRNETDLLNSQYDPVNLAPMPHYDYEVPDDHHVVIDLPAAQVRAPLEDAAFMPYAVVIPKLSPGLVKHIDNGLPVLLREMETGRLYFTGPSHIAAMPEDSGRYARFYRQARKIWEELAGKTLPHDGHVLVIEGVHEIAHNAGLDMSQTGIKLPQDHFDQLTWPRGAHKSVPLTGFILRRDYYIDMPVAGQPLLLHETRTPPVGLVDGQTAESVITGHGYTAMCRDVRSVSLESLYIQITSGEFSDEVAHSFGYASAWDAFEQINSVLMAQHVPHPMRELFLMVSVDPVKPESWFYNNPHDLPKAVLCRANEPLSAHFYPAPKLS